MDIYRLEAYFSHDDIHYFHQNYATIILSGLVGVCCVLSLIAKLISYDEFSNKNNKESHKKNPYDGKKFKAFQYNYIFVYFVVMFADWLQGTNMYTLYQGYGVDIATLFLTGFLSSMFFGTFVGSYIDSMGRKKACVLYCILEIIIQMLEHINDFKVLIFGRILGGISTSLLFSTFESWLVTEHRHRKFPEHLLSETFSWLAMLNGLAAILAGLCAQFLFYHFGDIGPFQCALGLTIVALVIIQFTWTENYGREETHNVSNTSTALKLIRENKNIPLLCLSQALFEGTMFTFVFMWVPTLQRLSKERPPIETIFSCFMVCVTIGGLLFNMLTRTNPDSTSKPRFSMDISLIGLFISAIAVACMTLSTVYSEKHLYPVLVAFFVYEMSVGLFHPWSATMRSRVIDESVLATVINIFRVPLNSIVVAGVYMSDNLPPRMVFSACALGNLLSYALLLHLDTSSGGEKSESKKKSKKKTK